MRDDEIRQRLEELGQPYLAEYRAEYRLVSAGLSAARMIHSLGVAATAAHLAEKFGCDPAQAYLAGLCHDAAKELPVAEMRALLQRSPLGGDADVLAHKSLWHAPAGSIWLADHQAEYPRLDAAIQSACLWHTLGKPAMTPLEQIVFIADLIEPGRDFPDLAEIRAAADISLTRGMTACMYGVIHFLEVRGQFVHPLAYAGYEYYKGLQ
ncbi:MAG: bis(5'-nucleosyl)-tetraphosphatase (symmetrical) YqeK [Firmicutes bacterium]|nr:bis(5'-nucleosyl)-tetraphosphatase (symmetrical) YqeK [Bacillota bacterium]